MGMKCLGFCLVLLVPGLLHAQRATLVQQKFISGGTIRLHLEAGGYCDREFRAFEQKPKQLDN